MSSLNDWSRIIEKQGEEYRTREEARAKRLDAMVASLAAASPFWWAEYSGAAQILHSADPVEQRNIKRQIVERHLWIAVQAACAAGLVKEVE